MGRKGGSKLRYPSLEFDINASSRATILVQDDIIVALNEQARQCIPRLELGGILPDALKVPPLGKEAKGTVRLGDSMYELHYLQIEGGAVLSFAPSAQTTLTDLQLDNTIRELRQRMGEFVSCVGPYTRLQNKKPLSGEDKANVSHCIYRMMRLLENLDGVRQIRSQSGQGICVRDLNLVALCQDVLDEVQPLLANVKSEVEVKLTLSKDSMRVVPGDEDQLRKLLLELLSNAIRATKKGCIEVQLSRQRRQGFQGVRNDRMILTVSNPVEAFIERHYAAMVRGENAPDEPPMAGWGVGIGLPLVRKIVEWHRGTMLIWRSETHVRVTISLPAKSMGGTLRLSNPKFLRKDGFSDVLMGLSDVLSDRAFEAVELD